MEVQEVIVEVQEESVRKETNWLSGPRFEHDPMPNLFVKIVYSLKITKLDEKPYWGRAWRHRTMAMTNRERTCSCAIRFNEDSHCSSGMARDCHRRRSL